MKKCRLIVMSVVVTVFCLWSSLSLAYEQYFTYPGTRAMGMAGAFIGQADDSSAVWYNPAGLMQPNGPKFDATAEYGKLPKRDKDGKYGSESNLKFVSFFYNDGSGWSVGLSYFVPYQISLDIPVCPGSSPCSSSNPIIGRVDSSYQQWSLAFASLLGSRLSLGGSLDVLAPTMDVANVDVKSSPGGVGYGAGAQLKVLSSEYVNINAGIMYKSKINMTVDDAKLSTPAEKIIALYMPSRPTAQGVGLNFQFPISFLVLNTNIGYEQTFWSDAFLKDDPYSIDAKGMDYTRKSFGGELIYPVTESTSLALRGGWNESTPEDENKFVTIKSITYGFGIGINKKHFLDIASEKREFTGNTAGSDNSYDFWSISYSFQP